MTIGPSPDWNKIPVRWHDVYLDGTRPTGTLEISVLWNRAVDDDTEDPIWILGSKPLIIDINTEGPTDFQLPATDDPDISQQGYTYQCKENLDQGGGTTFTFDVPLAAATSRVLLVRVPTEDSPIAGDTIPAYGRMRAGVGEPTIDVGYNGDWYIDTYEPTALVLYGPKSNGVWPDGMVMGGTIVGDTLPTKLLEAGETTPPPGTVNGTILFRKI